MPLPGDDHLFEKRKTRLAVLVSGGGSNLQALIDAIYVRGEIDGDISVVISSNAGAFALKRAEQFRIPAAVASLKDHGSPESRDAFILKTLREYAADYVILAGYLGILTDGLVKAYENRIVNIHPALLPKFGGKNYHGLNVHRAVIEAGERKSGATVHFVDTGVDTGLAIAQESLKVLPEDTPQSLQARILDEIEHPLLVRVVRDLCDGKIKVADGKVVYEK